MKVEANNVERLVGDIECMTKQYLEERASEALDKWWLETRANILVQLNEGIGVYFKQKSPMKREIVISFSGWDKK